MNKYRLPNGEYTDDEIAYFEVYETMANAVLKYFPGFMFYAISNCYGLIFAHKEDYQNGKTPDRARRFDL